MARFAGKLHTWNEERGFGFIRPVDGGQDIFVHVSALPAPRPKADEVLTFAVALNREGKKKAVDVRRQQVEAAALAADVERAARRPARVASPPRGEARLLQFIILVVVVAALGWQGYRHYERAKLAALPAMPAASVQPAASTASFQCDGRTHCREMKSCEEAKFFLDNCPGTKMDGDGDGIPCEDQHCR